jgi:hypothetical protein
MIRNALAAVGLLVIGWVAWTWARVSAERSRARTDLEVTDPYNAPREYW